MDTKRVTVKAELGDAEGSVRSIFSTFGVVDSDDEIVVASAIENGRAVPMAWGHDWQMPVGKGVVTTSQNEAIFDGRFFLSSSWGRDAYQTVKEMAELQEWSWGFRVLDSVYEERDGKQIRVITKTDLFEVSPVLRGAGENTRTLNIKNFGLTFGDQINQALAAQLAVLDRGKALAALRAGEGKAGRAIGRANWERMIAYLTQAREAVEAFGSFLDEHDPNREADADPEKAARIREGRREQLRYLTNRARQMATLGV